ncbi:MAG: hypothetical protein IID41_03580, partial [Planctomycetes bacterium]|nr:hypothetical protein [Planctomycetota bacterium]
MRRSLFGLGCSATLTAVLMWCGTSITGCGAVSDGDASGGGDHPHKGQIVPLDEPVDPTGQRTAEDHAQIGHVEVDGRIVELILEPAKSMLMLMGGAWMEMTPAAGADIHVEVKVSDPGSKTRIPHSAIEFHAENVTTGQTMVEELHPMCGGSGLHY